MSNRYSECGAEAGSSNGLLALAIRVTALVESIIGLYKAKVIRPRGE